MMGVSLTMRFLFALLSVLFLLMPSLTFAQEASLSSDLLTSTPAASAVSYTLPYPGILPGSPLYPLKMLRDHIILFLITDPYKKAEFNLLQADKRLNAGLYLLDNDTKNVDLAITTISKGENFFHQAIHGATLMKKEGRDVGALLGNFEQSAARHKEIVTNLMTRLPEKKEELGLLRKQIEGYQQQIIQLEKK